MRVIARDPLVKTKETNMFDVTVVLKGGGIHAQAEALRHGLRVRSLPTMKGTVNR